MNNLALFICSTALVWCGLVPRTDADDSRAQLQTLVDSSDLVVVATPQTVCGMCLDNGPYPNGKTLTPRYKTFYPRLKIDHVLKGELASGKTFWINYTVLRFESKDPPNKIEHQFSFKVDPSAKVDEIGLPNSPRKGMQYIFFLQDRKKHEPKSHEALGREEVVYRTFDFESGMIPANRALIIELGELAKGG